MRAENPDNMDLFTAGCNAWIEGDDRRTKLWDRVPTVLASVKARTTIVMAGDFNGHVECAEGPNGDLHPAQSNNTNGERPVGACLTASPSSTQRKPAQRSRRSGMVRRTLDHRGTRHRVDCFAASGHVLGEVEEVQAQLRAALRLRPGGAKPGSETFDLYLPRHGGKQHAGSKHIKAKRNQNHAKLK